MAGSLNEIKEKLFQLRKQVISLVLCKWYQPQN